MRNFFKTSVFLWSFLLRGFRGHFRVSKESYQFRRFIKRTYCKDTRKIIFKYFSVFKFYSHYYNNPKAIVEDVYIYLEGIHIDLQKCKYSFAMSKKNDEIEREMKWLEEKEGVDLP